MLGMHAVMPPEIENAKLRWENGVPVSTRFDDPYYTREDGLAETRHVFLDGNRLSARWVGAKASSIAELGFGTGLNFLATWALWRDIAAPGATLTYTAFELYPMAVAEMASALAAWSELAPLADALLATLTPDGADLPGVRLHLIGGDARQTLPAWRGAAETWFLDGFAPQRNPEMWGAPLMQEVYDHTVPGGRFATYTAAGHVRRALQAAGFTVERSQGFGRKREMLTGTRSAAAIR